MIDPLIVPFYLTIQSAVGAITNLINGAATDKQTETTADIAAKNRAHALHLERLRLEHERTMDDINANERRSNIRYVPGGLLDKAYPGLGTDHPVIIFDNMLYYNTSIKENNSVFNVMDSIYNSFKRQSNKYNPLVASTSIKIGFTSDTQVLVFHNLELAKYPSLVIFGSFDGTSIFLKASYRGITDDQFHVENGRAKVKSYKTDTVELFKIPYSAIYRLLEQDTFSEAEKQECREYLQNLIDVIVGSVLQILIDSYYVITDSSYEPIAGTRIDELEKMKKWFDKPEGGTDLETKQWTANRDRWIKSIDELMKTLVEKRKQLVAKRGAWSNKRRAQKRGGK